jgi:hypothetical protein
VTTIGKFDKPYRIYCTGGNNLTLKKTACPDTLQNSFFNINDFNLEEDLIYEFMMVESTDAAVLPMAIVLPVQNPPFSKATTQPKIYSDA